MAVVFKRKEADPVQLAAPVPATKKLILGSIRKTALNHGVQGEAAVMPLTVDVEMSQRQKDALAAVGLYEGESTPIVSHPKAGGITIKKADQCGTFSIGSSIQISNALFPWIATWRAGDTGTITAMWPAPPDVKEDKARYNLYEVKLDKPVIADKPSVLLHGWEIKEVINSKEAE